jgi:hypothetical protein
MIKNTKDCRLENPWEWFLRSIKMQVLAEKLSIQGEVKAL